MGEADIPEIIRREDFTHLFISDPNHDTVMGAIQSLPRDVKVRLSSADFLLRYSCSSSEVDIAKRFGHPHPEIKSPEINLELFFDYDPRKNIFELQKKIEVVDPQGIGIADSSSAEKLAWAGKI